MSLIQMLLMTVFTSELQTAGSEYQKMHFVQVVVAYGWPSVVVTDRRLHLYCRCRTSWWRYNGIDMLCTLNVVIRASMYSVLFWTGSD